MRVQDIMTKDVRTIQAEAPAEEAWELLKLWRIHHLVALDDRGRPLGVISDRDLGSRGGAALRKNRKVSDLMSVTTVSAPSHMTTRDAANLLRGHSIGCLPVIDEGKLVGIVTITDMLEIIGQGGSSVPGGGNRWKPIHRTDKFPRVSTRRV